MFSYFYWLRQFNNLFGRVSYTLIFASFTLTLTQFWSKHVVEDRCTYADHTWPPLWLIIKVLMESRPSIKQCRSMKSEITKTSLYFLAPTVHGHKPSYLKRKKLPLVPSQNEYLYAHEWNKRCLFILVYIFSVLPYLQ
jgi:hypothetical protein